MNRKSKSLFSLVSAPLTILALGAYLVLPNGASKDHDAFCADGKNITMVQDLPVSHPKNKCASRQLSGVSWSSWFSGRSSSYQFHFIDLLELLSRSKEPSSNNPAQTKS